MGQGRHTLRSISDPVYPKILARKIPLLLQSVKHTDLDIIEVVQKVATVLVFAVCLGC